MEILDTWLTWNGHLVEMDSGHLVEMSLDGDGVWIHG